MWQLNVSDRETDGDQVKEVLALQKENIKMDELRVPLSAKENNFNTVLCVSAYLCIF